MRSPAVAGLRLREFKVKQLNSNCGRNGNPQGMPKGKAYNAKSKSAEHIRQPVYAKIHTQKPPRERQQHHDPAVLRHAIEHRTRHRQIVHRMPRRETVLVQRRHLRLDLRIRGKGTWTLGAEFDAFVNHKTHRKRHQSAMNKAQI